LTGSDVLVGEYFSPWTEKARWALDHHRIAYRYREHVPLLGEPLLRLRSRRLRGRVSVPLLITDEGPIPDSFAIFRHAERVGRGAPLVPVGREAEVVAWNARSEAAIAASRALYLLRAERDREALIEMQPAAFPRPVREASLPVARAAIAFLRRKYGIAADGAEEALDRELTALHVALDGGEHLLDARFSYADVAMAVSLQFVAPLAEEYLHLGPATRASCRAPALADRFADLVAWRDRLYLRHRRAT
jgi:glutathione S-transferase